MQSRRDPPTDEPDLIVIGGGPAGLAAAAAAAAHGLRVMLVGGTVPGRASLHPGITLRPGETVWSVAGAFRVDTVGADGPRHYHAAAIIVAADVPQRVVPFPGWTLPAVVGLAEAASLLAPQPRLASRRVLVAGCGPLLASAAVTLHAGGAELAAVIDLAGARAWRGRGDIELLWRLRRIGVPVLHRATVAAVSPDAAGLRVSVSRVDGAGRTCPAVPPRDFTVDAVAVGHGVASATDVTRLLRARHRFDAAQDIWRPVLDADGRSSVPGVYVMEDAAAATGRLVGLAAAHNMSRISAATRTRPAAALRRHAPAANRALAALTAPRAGLIDAIQPATVICPCEAVTRAEIDEAVRAGARDLNQLKAWTRCGMGHCQGRICADTVGALLGAHGIVRQDAGQFTGRTPLRPLPLDLLTGEYGYADIALPPAAPL